jgi:hypothetical protein
VTTHERSRSGQKAIAVAVIVLLVVGCGSPIRSESPATAQPSTVATTPTPSDALSEAPPTPTVQATPSDSIGVVGREQLGAARIAFFDESHGLVVGAGGPSGTDGVVRSTSDGGRTWGPTIVLDSGPLVGVAVIGPQRAWAVASCDNIEAPADCVDGLFRSDDGGTTWTRISSTVATSPSFVDEDHGWAIQVTNQPTGDTDRGFLATTDGGRTWHAALTGCSGRFGATVAVSFVDRLHGWVGCDETYGAGGAAKGIAETIDGGHDWLVRSGTSGDLGSVGSIDWSDYLFALAMRPNGTGMWLGQRGMTARTSSFGKTWTSGPPGDPDSDIPSGASLPTDRTWFLVMWLANAQETVLERSDDAGKHWSIVGPFGAP